LLEDAGDGLAANARDHLSRIRRAVKRMGELIDDLLQLSRLSRIEVRRERVDISRLARAIVDDLARRDHDREVEVRIAPGLTAQADPRLVRILLENLIGNAWKFTRDRRPARIEVLAGPPDGSGFAVRDNGAGFDMAFAGQLFKPFHRLHRTDQFEGSGIGLATVQRIVHRHGGRIWAEGRIGEGATFYFTFHGSSPGADT
jgi:light-regulated signal transduction histidine kinase (bacteriophytochrome)